MASSVPRAAALAAVAALVLSGTSVTISAQLTARRPIERDQSRDIICGPQAAIIPPAPAIRVLGGEQPKRHVFGANDVIIVDAGSAQGVRVGQEYFVRRIVRDEFAVPVLGFVPVNIHTAGVARIVEVDTNAALARIADSCDGALEGDYLEAFVRPVVPVAISAGQPDFATAGVIVLGDERRQMAGAGDTMVLDRGTEHGVQPGQRGTVFRPTRDAAGPIVRIGEATAVLVLRDTSMIRIDSSHDAIMVGDRVALHK